MTETSSAAASALPPEPLPVTRPVRAGTAKLLPDTDRARAWLLTVDGAPQSYVDLDEPTYLEFEYVRRIAHALDTVAGEGEPVDALHLGGGALTLPRYVAATRPGSRQRVAEYDGELLDMVAEHLPLPHGAEVALEARDARAVLESADAGSADVIVADVFAGSRVPAHLTTLTCVHAAARALRPGGVYAANLADAAPFSFLGPQLATVGAVFPEVCLIAEPAVLRGRRFGNAVLLASRAPLPLDGLARRCAADAFPARVVSDPAELRRITGDAAPVRDEGAASSPEPPEGAFSVG
ncbi:fused MFS/spermidine synthase [Streptomyces sp. ODS28]|uniref:spermidine synthase n=1 Tax=Streptomyces sp. ODS28 TaxID=3136688 RepID=UPI0031EEAE7D